MPGPTPFSLGRFGDDVPRHLGVDLRALAAFRVALGIMVLVDLLNRWALVSPHYSDHGLLPRAATAETQNAWHLSLHLFSGEPWAISVLFGVQALVALLLVVGFRSRLMAGLLWFLLASLHARAPEFLQSGDVILRLYLLWGMLLPLGGVWSVDRALDTSDRPPPAHVQTMASAGLMIQILAVYLFTGLLKTDPAWLPLGLAVQHALMLEQFTTPLAVILLDFPWLLRVATWGTMALELGGPLLLLLPWTGPRLRAALVVAFVLLHLSFIPLMTLGQFPFISLLGWILFLPPGTWDRLGRRHLPCEAKGVTLWYDRDCGFCRKVVHLIREFLFLGPAAIRPVQEEERVRARFEARNTWVVETPDGRLLDRFDGLVYLLKLSRSWRWLGSILARPALHGAGERLYMAVARHRSLGGRLLAPARFRRMRWSASEPEQAFAFGLLVLVLLWNAWTLDPGSEPPAAIKPVGELLRIEQRWAMFAPYPLNISGRVVGHGTLSDGREVLLAPDASHPMETEALSELDAAGTRFFGWDREQIGRIRTTRMTAPRQRWRKFQERTLRDARLAGLYADFLCRDHAVRREVGEAALESVRLVLHFRPVIRSESRWGEPQERELAAASCPEV